MANPIPTNYPRVSPYLCVDDAAAAAEFYTNVFGARERMRIPMPDEKIGHLELEIGDGLIMISDEYPEMDVRGPKLIGGTPVTVSLYVEDVDAVYQRALDAGAESLRPPENQFYGDRSAKIQDPFGHRWALATHIEDVSPEEIVRRSKEMFGG